MSRTVAINGPAARFMLEATGHTNVSHIAKACDINRTTLTLIFQGKRRGGLDLAQKFSVLSGLPAHYFFGPTDTTATEQAA